MKTPVLLIMFTRWQTFEKVFAQVKLAKPPKLYLYQDGPRSGDKYESDLEDIMRCREIASDIDWSCEVIRWYMDKNIGCDPGSYYAYKKFFTEENKGIILEDDAVPSLSFFRYCEELLDRYENDSRVYRICGANIEGVSDVCDSYFFSRKGSTGSWATWGRVAEMWSDSYSFLDDKSELEELRRRFESKDYYDSWRGIAVEHRDSGKAFYETIFYENKIINGMLDIIPAKNLVTNIGLTKEAVHNNSHLEIPRALRKYFGAPRYELDFPLKHPDGVVENMNYLKSINRMMGWGHPGIRFIRRWETRFVRLAKGNKEDRQKLLRSFLKKIGKYERDR